MNQIDEIALDDFPDCFVEHDLHYILYDDDLTKAEEINKVGSQSPKSPTYTDLQAFLYAGSHMLTPGNQNDENEQAAKCAADVMHLAQFLAGFNESQFKLDSYQTMLRRLLDLMNGFDLRSDEVMRYMQVFATAVQRHLKIPDNATDDGFMILTGTRLLAHASITIQNWPMVVKVILQSGVMAEINGPKTVQKILGFVTHAEGDVVELSTQGPPPSPQQFAAQERQPTAIHSIQRPKCAECQLTFSSKSMLNRHMKTHGGEKICTFCKAPFRNRTSLTKHENVIHDRMKS